MLERKDEHLTDRSRFIPEALRRVRQATGLRQIDVHAKSGLSKAMVSAYEAGKALPSLPSLLAYLAALGRDMADLQEVLNDLGGLPERRSEDVEGQERTVGRAVLKALRGLQLTEIEEPIQRSGEEKPRESSAQQGRDERNRRPDVVFVLLTDSAGMRSETYRRNEELATNECNSTNPAGR